MVKLKIGKATINWKEGFLPECNCLFSKIFPMPPCWHIKYIAERRKYGDRNFLFKSEGGKLSE